ncbi:MAG: ybgF [Gammaproteobacteria bacterium]|nr:ybgF [Gammaproteobacteria bacterium]
MVQPVFAQAPVVDLNQSRQPGAVTYPAPIQSTSSYPGGAAEPALPPGDELRLLRQQVNNITQLDLPGKIDALQQQIQELNGRLELQAHQIETLTTQQKSFYEDLNQRLTASSGSSQASKGVLETPGNDIRQDGDQPVSDIPTVATPSATSAEAEEKAYQAAFALLTKKQNTAAISAFNNLLTTYPKGKRTPSAYYWLGELYSGSNKPDLAAKQLNLLITEYPNDEKVPDAMLKLAIIDDNNGQREKARQTLTKIVQKYPNSSAARLASMRLQRK